MSRDAPAFQSYAEFYTATYGTYIREMAPLGRSGAALLLAEQTAGDFSDQPTSDLAIIRPHTHSPGLVDFGGGARRQTPPVGHLSVIPPGFATTAVLDGPHAFDVLAIPYRRLVDLAGPDLLPADGNFGALHAGFWPDRVVSQGFAALWREGRSGAADPLLVDAALLTIASRLRTLSRRASPQRPRGGLAPWQLRRVTAYMTDHLDTEVGLAEVSALVGLSPSHFCTAFRQSTGQPPHAWLLRRRIERAQEMMSADPSLGLTEVAQAVGYAGQSAFGAAFRRITGTTPSAWRRQARR